MRCDRGRRSVTESRRSLSRSVWSQRLSRQQTRLPQQSSRHLICLKTRNAIIISPHPAAKACTIEAAKVVLDAAVKAGAPEGIIGWIDAPSLELTNNGYEEMLTLSLLQADREWLKLLILQESRLLV